MHNKIIRTGEINNGRPFSTGTRFGIATKKYVYSLFILLAALLITTNAKASKDPDVVQQLSGDVLSAAWPYPIINGAVCNVEDINYYDLNIRSRITDISKDKYKNTIALIIREEPKTSINNPAKYIPNNFTYSVTINITWYDLNENAHTENNVTLTVSYTKEAGAKYDARQYYYLNDARKVEVTVVNAPAPANGAWDPRKVLIIENRLIAYRDYNFDKQLPPGINSKTNLTDELKIDWYFPVDKGATHFDIEWAWIDIESIENYKSDDNGTLRLDPDLIFKRNSTRVTVQNNNYNIPLLYDGAGYLYYRIRPMQYREDGGILEGSWSVSTREGAEAADNYYSFTGHELNQFNWQASTTFAEEGKRKTVIQYFDGTLRSRQTVTKDNSTPDKNTVVAETLYDYQGRPSINILPAPTLSTVIGYARNFNRFIGQAAAQHPKDMYDVLAEGQTVCSSVPVALDNTQGTAQYYSPNNPLLATVTDNFNKFIPDANGFPYTETRYVPDGTGRIAEQSGVGPAHKLNSGHQTKYFYGAAAQEEIDGLFGLEAGYASHYFKNLVQDANGQVSVSYTDMHGRTVATALAGEAPANLTALPSKPANYPVVVKNLLTEENNLVQGRSVVSSSTLLVSAQALHTFTYSLLPQSALIAACTPPGEQVCYSCYYTLQIKITDNCGNVLKDQAWNNLSFTNGSPVYDASCSPTGITIPPFDLLMDIGEYNITKILTVDKGAQDWYRQNTFKTKLDLCKTLEQIKTEVLTNLMATSDCQTLTCATCTTAVGADFTIYKNKYLQALNLPAATVLPPEKLAELLIAYNEALDNCLVLCNTNETELQTVEQQMLDDMIPGTGQYAQMDEDLNGDGIISGTSGQAPDLIYENGLSRPFNIMRSGLGYPVATHIPAGTPMPYYKIPADESGNPSIYKLKNNAKDNAAYIQPGNTLVLDNPEEFAAAYNENWTKSLIYYHPEYPKLAHAKQYLAASYTFSANLQDVETWAAAEALGYIEPTFTDKDPFYNVAGTSYKWQMDGFINSNYVYGNNGNPPPTSASFWKLAYVSIACINIPNTDQSCFNNAPSTPNGTNWSLVTSRCTADKDYMWQIFKALYLSVKNNQVNQYLQNLVPQTVTNALNDNGYQIRFGSFDDFVNPYTVVDNIKNNIHPEDAAQSALNDGYIDNCDSYIQFWENELEACKNSNPLTPISDAIINQITAALKNICIQGSDENHPLGASTVKPSSANTNPNRKFEDAIQAILAQHNIPVSALCHPFMISYPRPYEQQPPLADDITVNQKDSCLCNNLEQLKQKMIAKNYDVSPVNLATSMQLFLLQEFKITITATLLDSLITGCNTNTNCNTYNPPLQIPGFLAQCKNLNDNCIDCIQYNNFKTQFTALYPVFSGILYTDVTHPQYEAQIKLNEAFAAYINNKTGFNKTWMEYAGFEAECNNSTASPVNNGCEGLETLQNTFRVNYFTKPAFPITYNSDGCDVSSWGFYRNPAVDYKTIFSNGVVAAPGGAFHFDYGHAMCVTDEFTINYHIMPLSQPALGQIYIPISIRAGTVFTIFYLWMNNGSGAIQDGAAANYTTVPGLSYTPHLNSWVNIGVKFKPSNGEVWVYVNGVQVLNKITSFTGANTINAVNSLSLQTFVGMEMKLDRVKIDNNTNGDVIFDEEFNGACSNFAIINPAYDCAKAPCPTAFQTYYNQVKGTNLTYAQIQTVYANCAIPFNPCINIPPPPNGPRLCGIIEPPKLPELIVEGPCDYLNDMALQIATQQYNAWLTIQNDRFDETYLTRCLQARNYESFTVSAQQAEYHYTLYYYDQAGSLVKTVPPQGVQANFTPAFINLVKAHRLAGNAIAYTGAGANVPAHTLVTQYRYNSLNQVVAQISPDGGLSHFWYDELGRLAISQNARQKMTNKYSYTLYDDLGRIKEVGQKTNTTLMSQVISQDKAALYSWITSTLNREQITRTTYDAVATNLQVSYPQQNLRNRVSFTQVFDAADPGIAENFNHNNATYYTYDIHGNVDVLLQDYKALMEGNSPGNRFKIIKYRYDLISGKVNEVAYQPGMIDGYMHHYEYDAENRITQVLTSRDAEFNANTGYRGGYWERDATYKYYRHGPLARSVLGQLQVQGLDYAYTLQGWLKGVNSTAINGATDMGGDGAGSAYTGAALNPIARDAYSYSLNYFNGDYTHISTTAATPFANILTAGGGSLPALADGQQTGRALYNGNIAAMAVNIPKLGVAKIYGYNYDQLNRITAMNGYNGFNNANNSFAPSTTEEYKERINYDANGNILNYLRNGDAARMSMDNMQYSYNAGNNQLNKVVDNAQDASTSEYDKYNDIKQGQNTGNYQYDEIGNLISDVSEGITNITWNVYGKIQTITKVKNEVNTLIYYTYDAAGNRISKQVSQPDVFYSASTLIYVRDASGNVMSVYRSFTAPSNEVVLKQTEVHLYGSSRLGIVNTNVDVTNGSIAVPQASITTFARGYKSYELSNHLGNVLVTISDKKLLVIPGDDGSGCVPGTGINILNVYSRSTAQLTYIARQEVNLLPDFESLNPDEFTAYIDPALPECIPIESVPLPPGSYYSADVITANDYYPGGMQMPGRKYAQPNSSYRYGFNGKENDNEVKGEGNQQDYGLRIYDPRLGKFLSVDPLTASYPWYSPYQFAGNNPIKFIDLDGGEPKDPGKYDGQGAIAPQIVDGNTCADTENDRWTWKNSQWNYTTFNVTNSELASVFPTGKTESLKQVETSVNLTGSTFGINSKKSLAHFLSQAGAEVGGFSKGFDIEESLNYSVDGLTGTFGSYFYNGKAVAGKLDANLYGRITVNKKVTQLANQEGIGNQAYASRMGNGDFASGDGYKYRGRGMFQLTGKFNYTAFNNFINEAGVDIVAKPELILTTAYAIKSAMWYYKTAVVDKLKIESATVEQVTKKVNGGKNGLSDRETIYDNAIENLK